LSDQGLVTNIPFPAFSTDGGRFPAALPNINYTAPEIVVTRKCYAQSDIFSFGCLFYEMLTSKPIQKVKSLANFGAPIAIPGDVAPEFRPLLEQCLQVSSQIRPTARAVLASEWFQTMSLRILTYLDLLITKEPKEKFGFFKGLSQAIHGFSPLMIKAKILPILVQECRAEIRFAPVLLGTIYDVAGKFSVSAFTYDVFTKIAFLTTVSDPPEVVIALLQSIPLIIEKTDPSLHNDCVYPIVFNALQSPNELIQRECLSKLPFTIERIQPAIIRTSLLPRLVELGAKATDVRVAASALTTVARCLKKIDHDTFLQDTMPKISQIWRAHASAAVAEPMMDIIEAIAGNAKLTMAQVLPIAAAVTATPACPPYVQKRLCVWVINFLEKYKLEFQLDRKITRPHYTVAPRVPAAAGTGPSPVKQAPAAANNPFGFDLPPADVSTAKAAIGLPPVTPTQTRAFDPIPQPPPRFQGGYQQQFQPQVNQFPTAAQFQGGFGGQNAGQFQTGGFGGQSGGFGGQSAGQFPGGGFGGQSGGFGGQSAGQFPGGGFGGQGTGQFQGGGFGAQNAQQFQGGGFTAQGYGGGGFPPPPTSYRDGGYQARTPYSPSGPSPQRQLRTSGQGGGFAFQATQPPRKDELLDLF
jgi:hypothetical protein